VRIHEHGEHELAGEDFRETFMIWRKPSLEDKVWRRRIRRRTG